MNKKDSQNLANNLVNILKINSLSIEKLANLLNIPPMTIRRLVSGETMDPRISTLQLIANYFKISLDSLMSNPEQELLIPNDFNQFSVPIISWNKIENFINSEIPSDMLTRRQLITIPKHETLNKKLFAIESKPSMYSIYPQGTIFIIASEIKPVDGDLVLIKFLKDNAISLKKLQIDPPELYLHQIILNNHVIKYIEDTHSILGIVILTLLYNHSSVL